MGQYDIWELFDKHPDKWMDANYVTVKTGCSRRSIGRHLSKLRKYNILYRKLIYNNTRKNGDMVIKYKLVPNDKKIVKYNEKDVLISK